MIPRKQKVRIGDFLVSRGEITEAELDLALKQQKQSGLKLGRILIDSGFIDEDRFLTFLSEQFNIPFYDLTEFEYQTELVAKLPETLARRYRALILEEQGGELVVGMVDPMDIFAYDEISRQLGQPVAIAVVRESELLPMLDVAYRKLSDIESFASELEGELGSVEFDLAQFGNSDEDDSTPVARLLNSILEDAVQIRASDVHIEPDEDVLRIRRRVDGVLQEQIIQEKRIASALVSRLKLMAGLDISEKRLPQDGRFDITIKNHAMDVRLSTMPVQEGESVVMRIVDHGSAASNLNEIGMSDEMLQRFRFLITRPNGLVLVTGPTGSGKTTTLYGALAELNTPEKKIITVEDPVEYQLSRVNQVQVKPKIGLDFAKVLRATLRQDPDILLVGEIRDRETAEIALRASMTGHLVLSTLHTNDAVSSATRLLDIGVEGYLAASAIRGVIAQRLVRKNCERCREVVSPDDQQFAWLDQLVGEKQAHSLVFHLGTGCNRCSQTGYYGRIAVFELLELDEGLANFLRRDDAHGFELAARAKAGYRSLVLNALDFAIAGETSLNEVMALSGQVEDLKLSSIDPIVSTLVSQESTQASDSPQPGAH